MKLVQQQVVWFACALALASSACAAGSTGMDVTDDASPLTEDGHTGGVAAGAVTNEEPLVVGMPEEAQATMGRERFGGHPEPWTPPPWPGPKPEK